MFNRTEEEIMKNWKGDISQPIVSICCVTYNHEKYITEAIESFLMQETNFPFEIIIGEDCSTDNTKKVIEKYLVRYSNIIKLVISNNNVGMIQNFLRVFKKGKGKYIALCEGDDYWTDVNKLQIQKDFLNKNEDYVICYHRVEAFDENGTIESYSGGVKRDLDQNEMKKAMPINTLTTMYRNVIEEFPTEMNSSKYVDLFLWSILGAYGKGKFLESIKPARYRMHVGGIHSYASHNDKYENTLITNTLLMAYHKRLGNTEIVFYLKKRILHAIIQTNGFNFITVRLIIEFIFRFYYKFKQILKKLIAKSR